MVTVAEKATSLGIAVFALCVALGLSRASLYRRRKERPAPTPRRSRRALPPLERLAVRDVLNEERFADQSPAEVWATLLDEGRYHCSERTMYRILAEHQEVRERRDQLRHPSYAAPELLATGPRQLWSWDITKLRGPHKGVYYHLYVILDVYSRYVVGWMVAEMESAALAERLIAETCRRQGIERGQLTIHADRGSSMKSKAVALLLADLGVIRSHSRPHVSDDNPFSESQFKTLKYRPSFPDRFGALVDARAFCSSFFAWYNTQHHHSGIGLHTPHDVHHGLAQAQAARRGEVLAAAFLAHPERFPHGLPQPPRLSAAVWINKPSSKLQAPIEGGAGGPPPVVTDCTSRDPLELEIHSPSQDRPPDAPSATVVDGRQHLLLKSQQQRLVPSPAIGQEGMARACGKEADSR